MIKHSTTWKIPPWAWLPIGAAIAAEAVSNALRAYGLGQHLEKFTLTIHGHDVSISGSVLVLAAVAVSLSQARAAWIALLPTNPARQRVVAGLAAILLLGVSISAMASHIFEAQRYKAGDETGLRGAHERAQSAYTKAASELASLEGTRSTGEIQAAMAVAPVSRNVFRRTAQCTDVTRDDSFEACKPILDLRQEMARAIRKRELEISVPELKAELDGIKPPEEASVSETWVEGIWGWIMGFAVVFIATFGTVIFCRVETKPDDENKSSAEDCPSEPGTEAPAKAEHPAIRPSESSNVIALVRPSDDDDPKPPKKSRTYRKDEALADLLGRMQKNQYSSQRELADDYGVPYQTLSDWIKSWEADGLVIRRKEGRRKIVAAG